LPDPIDVWTYSIIPMSSMIIHTSIIHTISMSDCNDYSHDFKAFLSVYRIACSRDNYG